MRLGTPVLLDTSSGKTEIQRLTPITTRREDKGSFREDLLQELVHECPDVLPLREFLPGVRAVYSLGREIPVDVGGSTGYIDNLLVTDDGHLVIVETKLYRNPEATREVVAQTLQYGMALGRMQVRDLEAVIRRAMKPVVLKEGESLAGCVSRIASLPGDPAPLVDDWEDALERNLRRGEFLLLVVSDAIRIGVERVAHWLDEQGSSAPLRFGLVELKFYSTNDRRLVVPRTLLKTREISRHVVVVDIQPTAEANATARVLDDIRTPAGKRVRTTRAVGEARPPQDRRTILDTMSVENRGPAVRIFDALEAAEFEWQGTPAMLKAGFCTDDGEFHALVTFDWAGAWASLLKRDRDVLETEDVLDFKRGINVFGAFYRADKLDQPDQSGGCAVKLVTLEPKVTEFVSFLDSWRTRIGDALRQE